MKALVKYNSGDGFVELREVPEPKISKDEVLIKVKACGICGTDIHILHDEFKNYPPVIIGHEFSGEIVDVGKNVKEWSSGERVVSELHTGACGVCRLCRTGNYHICPEKRPLGSGRDGAFAEYIKVPSWLLHRIPDGISYEEAALTEPVAICLHCILEMTGVKPEDFVVIIGPGPIGLLSAQAVKASGAGKVMITGTSNDEEFRLRLARKLNIEYVINIDKENPVEKLYGLTEGMGADLVIEASGSETGINQAITMVRRGGRITALGMTKQKKVCVNWNEGIIKEISLSLPFSSNYDSWEMALSMIMGNKMKVAPLITHKMPLDKWNEGFKLVEQGKTVKTLLFPEVTL